MQQRSCSQQCAWVSSGFASLRAYRACSLLAFTSPRGVGCSGHRILQVCEAALPATLHPSRAALAEAPVGMQARVRHVQTTLDPRNACVERAA